MIDYFRSISQFSKEKKKINHKILILGRGRWSKVIIRELNYNFPNLKNIYVFSPKFKEKKNKRGNIILINSLNLIKEEKINYIIIANKNDKKFIF